MSSIKQVQDLQSRIAELTEENALLRTRMSESTGSESTRGLGINQRLDNQFQATTLSSKEALPPIKNLPIIQDNIRKYCSGIYGPPVHRRSSTTLLKASAFPDLPPRATFAHLSRSYLDSIHKWFPVLHWPTFSQDVDNIYMKRTFEGTSKAWVGLYFAVLACGSLNAPQPPSGSPKPSDKGSYYYDVAIQLSDMVSEETSTANTSMAVLLTIFATESNLIAAGAKWLATSVRLAQCLRLHVELEAPFFETEMRRRLWWAIYVLDRFVSAGAHLPMLIQDADCNTAMPSSLDDRYISSHGYERLPFGHPSARGALALIRAARLYSRVGEAAQSLPTTPAISQALDEDVRATLMLLPDSYLPSSDTHLEPADLPQLMAFQAARFLVYRQNITPRCRTPERMEAVRRSSQVAQETAKYISRAIHSPSGASDPGVWKTKVTQLASNLICVHLWRCILMLCFCGDYDAALMCAHLSATIGDTRKINGACGRNIAFFLELLLDRIRGGNWAHYTLGLDEEMLIYTSGDLQEVGKHAWVWTGYTNESEHPSPHSASTPALQSPYGHGDAMQGLSSNNHHQGAPTTYNGYGDWNGWAGVEKTIRQLIAEEHSAQRPQPSAYYPPPHNPVKRVQLAADAVPASPTRSVTAPPASSSASRISIANII
ncbi:hypothetical protein M011DRAFT_273657 [Sporormia fimetaria CBS 119925]|uniref:Xylanolytic transcriptional activator regulatory domain-containing protein n=1 Tax=Sporormia fimetaria CBS 119925 TaxID=1340428 RepID=A0A6A6VGI8_9PLEO|nr:hypothetical protein M011DRAFT_273657 [Sporormia fimetaria CBS 119925]